MKKTLFALLVMVITTHLSMAQNQSFPNPEKELKAEKKAIRKAEREKKKEALKHDKANLKYQRRKKATDIDAANVRRDKQAMKNAKAKLKVDKKKPVDTAPKLEEETVLK